jgi:hypothetical protein
MASTLSSCLLDRTPNDRPPPRRSTRRGGGEVDAYNVHEAEDDKPPSSKKGRKRKKTQNQQPKPSSSDNDSKQYRAATLAEIDWLLQQSSSSMMEEASDNTPSKSSHENNTTTQKKQKRVKTMDVGDSWVSGAFAARLDRNWLDQDAPQSSQLNSIKIYVPQPGDALLYYPAGHFQFLQKCPDHLRNKNGTNNTASRIPLWERAAQEQRAVQPAIIQGAGQERMSQEEQDTTIEIKAAPASNTTWWTPDWIDKAGSGKYRLPILCRVVKTQAEFPPDTSSQDPDNNINDHQASSLEPASGLTATLQSKSSRKRPVLRLAVTLQPLTPITPPLWKDDAGPVSSIDVPPPPVFTCVTFPSPLPAFLVPFAWSYIRNQTLVGTYVQYVLRIVVVRLFQPKEANADFFVLSFISACRNTIIALLVIVGEEVLHSPVKASVTGKPLHQKGKLLSMATMEGEEYGSLRLDDKLNYVAKVLSGLKKQQHKDDASDVGNTNSKGQAVQSLVRMSPLDAFVIEDFLEGFVRKHGAPSRTVENSNEDSGTTDADLMTLVRATFPVWMGASIQRGFEDRTRLEMQPWDLKTRDGPVGSDPAFTKFMDLGLHNTLDNMLRLKIECSIEEYLQATPTATPFQEQISEDAAPNYSAAVPITMSFRRILTRLKQRGKRPNPNSPCYYRSFNAVLQDIQSIEDNCRLYNASDSLVTQSAMKVVADAKKYISGVVASHVRELTDKLKEEDAKKQFLAAFVGEGDESPENAEDFLSVDPFREPWKGPLFRDWIQLIGEKHRGSTCPQWVPQAGDAVLYSRDMHTKYLEGHLDSLAANQCIALDDTIWNGLEAAVSEDVRVGSSFDKSKWVAATIISVKVEFPRVRSSSKQGTFDTDAPLLALRLQFSAAKTGEEQQTSFIYWRPCMFPNDISDEMNTETERCKTCGVQITTSFLRPSLGDHLGNQLQGQGVESSVGQSFACKEMVQIERNLNFLKRRCLLHVVPDKFDANLSTDQIRNGYFPAHVKVGLSALPQFDELLKAAEAETEAPSRLANKKKDSLSEIDTSALNTLAAVGFLPPWLPQVIEDTASKKKVSATMLHDSLSPCPNLCLELVLLRIKNGYYRHVTAVQNDLVEAFLNTQLLTWAPGAKRKIDPIAMKKLAKALSSANYAIATDDAAFTSITQKVTAMQKSTVNDTMASIKVRIVLEDPKENREIPANGRKAGAKAGKKLAKSLLPAKASGTKRKAPSPFTSDGDEIVLSAEVPMGRLQSLGREEAIWVQCDKCKKWRRLRGLVGDEKLPSRWSCSMNKTDPGRALCSAPEEEYDDADHEIVTGADAPKDVFSEEESSFVAHAELVRRLYAASLVGILEPAHFAVVFGLTSLHVDRQRILSTIVPETFTQADHQAAFARNQLGNLMKAIARDPCKSKLPKEIALKILADGELITGEQFSTRDPDTLVSVDGISFGKRSLKSNNKLTRVLLKPVCNTPCVRCQAARKGLYTCRGMCHQSALLDSRL